MKSLSNAILFISLLAILLSCNKSKDSVRPLMIQPHPEVGTHFIRHAFSLNDNTFVLVSQNSSEQKTYFFRYNDKLNLIDSVSVSGVDFCRPIVQENNFIMLGFNFNIGTIAISLSNNLTVEAYRNINHLSNSVPSSGEYTIDIVKMTDGTFVVINTFERFPNLHDKIALYAVNDFFKDNDVLWRQVPPTFDGSWALEAYPTNDNYIYVVGNDHHTSSGNFLLKYDHLGNIVFKRDLQPWFDFAELYVDDDKVVYLDNTKKIAFDHLGNELYTRETGITLWNSNTSTLIKKGDHYFCLNDVLNSDGQYAQISRFNLDLELEKTALFGNNATNIYSNPDRHLIKLSSGKMIFAALIQNADLTGNHWLIQSFDEDLKQID